MEFPFQVPLIPYITYHTMYTHFLLNRSYPSYSFQIFQIFLMRFQDYKWNCYSRAKLTITYKAYTGLPNATFRLPQNVICRHPSLSKRIFLLANILLLTLHPFKIRPFCNIKAWSLKLGRLVQRIFMPNDFYGSVCIIKH